MPVCVCAVAGARADGVFMSVYELQRELFVSPRNRQMTKE